MPSPASPKAVGLLTMMPHGVGSIVNTKSMVCIENHQWLDEYDYSLQRQMMDEGDYERALHHNALSLPALPLTKVLILNKAPRAPKGSKGLNRRGASKIKASAFVMERYIGRDRLTFLTTTVPEEAYVIGGCNGVDVNEAWPDIIHRFNIMLQRAMQSRDLTPTYVYVTEVQEGRYKDTGRVALHAHYLLRGRGPGKSTWALTHKDYQRMWRKALEQTIGAEIAGPLIVDVQRVKKSAVAYLGKYMSKGGEVVDEIVEAGGSNQLPSHWWGSTRGLKERVKRDTVKNQGDLADWVWAMCWEPDSEHFKWCFPIMLEYGDGPPLLVGFAFEFTDQFREEIYQHFTLGDGAC